MQGCVNRWAVHERGEAGAEVLPRGHKMNQGALEGGIARANPKLVRDKAGQALVAERHEPGRTAVTTDGNLRLEARRWAAMRMTSSCS